MASEPVQDLARFTKGDTNISLYHGDCIELMKTHIESASIDVVVTSPPYNIGIDYGAYDDTIDRDSYLEWISKWAKEVYRCLDDNGSLFLNMGSKPTDPWIPLEVASVLRSHFNLQNVIHWIKSIAITKDSVGANVELENDLSVGHYKPINSLRFLNDCHEYIFHFTKSGDVRLDRLAVGVPYQYKSNIGRWKSADKDLRCRGNTWFIPYETIQSRDKERPHPATFPSKLPEMCIKLHGLDRCKHVMDPFMGLGSTAIACIKLEMPFSGFELDEVFYGDAKFRVETAVNLGVNHEPSLFDY